MWAESRKARPIGAIPMKSAAYGSDFPNIPYAWDRELQWLSRSGLPAESLEWILRKSAEAFFNFHEE
jgi:hypothetical protein